MSFAIEILRFLGVATFSEIHKRSSQRSGEPGERTFYNSKNSSSQNPQETVQLFTAHFDIRVFYVVHLIQ